MYEAFYGFKEKPFSMLPDPGFLYLSKKHQAALALLEYGVLNHAGFCVISGEAGAGKTTILRALLERVPDNIKVGLITNTHQSFGGLLDWVLSAFDLHRPNLTQVEMHQIFMEYLIEEYANNRSVLLIVDEAQNMKPDALEELRMLSNVNSEKDQLMQVMLAGQPALKDTLRQPELMQFAQRIAVDYHLEALNHEETCGYIQHRLITAGAEKDVFTPAACERIYSYSGGTPRLINLLCETVLVYGFADQRELIDVDLVDEMVLERMKDSVVPIVNRDIAQQSNTKTSEELEKDFPWIHPEGGTQGLKPDQSRESRGKTGSVKKKKNAQAAVKKTAKNAPASNAEINKEAVPPGDGVKNKPRNVPANKPSADKNTKPASRDEPPAAKQESTDPVFKFLDSPEPAASVSGDVSAGKKIIKYGSIAAVIAFLLAAAYVLGMGGEFKSQAVDNTIIEQDPAIQEQRELEEARVLQLKHEAETLKKERDAAIAKAEEEVRAKEQAEKIAAEKAALAAKAAAEKEILEQKKRLAEAKEKERLAKQREAKARAEAERVQREAARLEEERLEMKLRLEEEMRLKQAQEARRLELEWQEKQRQAILDAENKAKAEAAAAAIAREEEAAIKSKSKSAECTGPTARFKANCR